MSALQSNGAQQADPLAWARALRSREHELGLGSPVMTPHARGLWRDVLIRELTDDEIATAPSVDARMRNRGMLPC